jgi:apolipoprotein N-acyltransferase
MSEANNPRPRFYFSLPRLIALCRGGDPLRSENNATEARVAGLAVYLISFLFFAQFVPANLKTWQSAWAFVGLAFFVCLFWLLVLYLNSLIIGVLRLGGIFRGIPVRRAQSILAGFSTTAMACSLLQRGSWTGEIAAIWLTAVTLNLVAAIVLALHHETRAREK